MIVIKLKEMLHQGTYGIDKGQNSRIQQIPNVKFYNNLKIFHKA